MDVRRRARDLLARREYGRVELARKLRRDLRRGATEGGVDGEDAEAAPVPVEQVLDDLVAEGSLSDERFVSSFVDARVRRGKGPLLIRAELEQRGAAESLIERFLTFPEAFWADHARSVRVKRFGAALPVAAPERARQARFLASRGFPPEAIRLATKP